MSISLKIQLKLHTYYSFFKIVGFPSLNRRIISIWKRKHSQKKTNGNYCLKKQIIQFPCKPKMYYDVCLVKGNRVLLANELCLGNISSTRVM